MGGLGEEEEGWGGGNVRGLYPQSYRPALRVHAIHESAVRYVQEMGDDDGGYGSADVGCGGSRLQECGMCPPLRVHTSVNRQVCEEIGDDVVVLLTQEVREREVWRRSEGGAGRWGGGKVGVCTQSLSVLPKSAVR